MKSQSSKLPLHSFTVVERTRVGEDFYEFVTLEEADRFYKKLKKQGKNVKLTTR